MTPVYCSVCEKASPHVKVGAWGKGFGFGTEVNLCLVCLAKAGIVAAPPPPAEGLDQSPYSVETSLQ